MSKETMSKETKNQEWACFASMMEPISDECLCIDPPGENHEDADRRDYQKPSCHSQYCPRYLYAYALALSKGQPTPP